MAIPTTIESLSTTAASNGPAGSEQRTLADDGLRQAYAFIRQLVSEGSVIASASSITPPSTGWKFGISGTTTITGIASTNSWNGREILLITEGAVQFTHSSNLALPGNANITTEANDALRFIQTGSGAWRLTGYLQADGGMSVPGSATITGTLAVTGAVSIDGAVTMDGAVTIGDASGDALTINSATVSAPNGLDFGDAAIKMNGIERDDAGDILINASDVDGAIAFRIAGGERLRITNDGRLFGTDLHNNSGALTGATNQYVGSGTYTPTLTGVANVAASTARACQWLRVGNVVTVSGALSLTASAGVPLELGISLPIASDFAAAANCGGVAHQFNNAHTSHYGIAADATNNRASLQTFAALNSAAEFYFSFTYVVL